MHNQENNTNKHIKAVGVTIAVHALLLVVLFLVGFSSPPPLPDQDLGMEVNLGTSDEGMGDEQPLNPNPPSSGAATASTPQAEATTADNSAPPQDIATQDEEDAPEVTKPTKPVEPPKEIPKTIEPKPTKTPKKVTEAPPAPIPPAPKPKAVFTGGTSNNANSGNSANGSNSSTGEGNTGKPGDRGALGGNPNGGAYTGSGLGGGRSDFKLNGRSLLSRPSLTYDGDESGYIAVNIKVDRQGNVIEASHSLRGSTLNNSRLIEIAKKAARELKYNVNSDAPEVQFALIRFYFKVQ